MKHNTRPAAAALAAWSTTATLALALLPPSTAHADVVTDWNQRSAQIVGEARLGTPPAVRLMALVQTAAHAAALDASRAQPGQSAAVEAAIAGAHRVVLTQLLPAQKAAVETAFQAALAQRTDDAERARQVAVGERAAQRVLADRAGDMPKTADAYRPHAAAGVYVPTAMPAMTQWPQRQTWWLQRADQLRPPAPSPLNGERWALDFNEVHALGGRDSKARSAEQTEIGRFWDYSMPAIYHGVLRSVALQPGRDVLANARLFATASQAMDDALIAVFDAKYTYNRWRPVTAIRNGDLDGNDATERDTPWLPLIDTPMHPEYPCAHCILAGTVATLLEAEGRQRPLPMLSTSSPSANGAVRRWATPAAFAQEVAQARIVGGVHFRNSTEVGLAMGRSLGEWVLSQQQRGARDD
ncbi:MAG: vanadium-dependent haloperoxidase [Burkholderiaceae bacterium]